MTWQAGRAKITDLISDGELDRVEPSDDTADRLLQDASRHLATAAAALSGEDLSGAYQLAYDALRKSAASLLAVQGLRATSRGGHIAVQDAVTGIHSLPVSPTTRPGCRSCRDWRNGY